MPTDDHLSGQQIQRISQQASAALQSTVDAMQLRRNCLELAVRVCAENPDAVVQLAQDMVDFVSKPATEVLVHVTTDPPPDLPSASRIGRGAN